MIVPKIDLHNSSWVIITRLNSHADGLAVVQPLGFEIDFVRNPISGAAAWFFVIILKFIFTAIFEIKIYEKNSLTPKKFYFRRPIFIDRHILHHSLWQFFILHKRLCLKRDSTFPKPNQITF